MIDEIIQRAQALAQESFIAASGPGGQNVNKVATAVQMRVNIYRLRLTPQLFHRVKAAAGNRMTTSGDIIIDARRHRTQDANRADARERLTALLEDALRPPTPRVKTRINRVGKFQRLKSKKARSEIKANRSKVDW